jgi:hypothetical protein
MKQAYEQICRLGDDILPVNSEVIKINLTDDIKALEFKKLYIIIW